MFHGQGRGESEKQLRDSPPTKKNRGPKPPTLKKAGGLEGVKPKTEGIAFGATQNDVIEERNIHGLGSLAEHPRRVEIGRTGVGSPAG